MKKQKRNTHKSRYFKTLNLNQKQLMNRWILVTIGLIILFVIFLFLLILFFRGKVNIPGIPQFAETQIIDSNSGSGSLQKQMREYIDLYNDYDYESLYKAQISKPQIGEEIAQIYIKGSDKPLKVKFFPDEASEIVEQFKTLVKKGFYDNIDALSEKDQIFKTIIADSDIEWEPIGDIDLEKQNKLLNNMESWDTTKTKSYKVLPYNGALCAYDIIFENEAYGVNFFIMNIGSKKVNDLTELNIPIKLQELFKKYGGDPTFFIGHSYRSEFDNINIYANLLDYLKHPTFGQIFEGMELIDKMIQTNKDYQINKIEIIKYKE